MELRLDDKYAIVVFNKETNIFSIENQFEILKQALNSEKPILLQAQKIDKIDPASLQLLMSFIAEIKKKKVSYQWQNPSATLCKAADSLGLRQALSLSDFGENKNAN